MPDARARVRIGGRSIIKKCVTAGLTFSRVDTDNGQIDSIEGAVRFASTDEPTPKVKLGDVIEVMPAAKTRYAKSRVTGRLDIGGSTRLDLQAEFDQ